MGCMKTPWVWHHMNALHRHLRKQTITKIDSEGAIKSGLLEGWIWALELELVCKSTKVQQIVNTSELFATRGIAKHYSDRFERRRVTALCMVPCPWLGLYLYRSDILTSPMLRTEGWSSSLTTAESARQDKVIKMVCALRRRWESESLPSIESQGSKIFLITFLTCTGKATWRSTQGSGT